MKNLLVCLSILFLSSCTVIHVDDFGAYWNKGYVDPALLGRWEMTTPKCKDPREEARSVKVVEPIALVTDNKGTYKIDSLIKDEKDGKDYTPQVARALDAGDYKFLMAGDIKDLKKGRLLKGTIYRYKSDGDKLFRYELKTREMSVFLEAKYPHEKNIRVEKSQPRCKKDCVLSIRIKKLDNEVYKILSSIPDTSQFWEDSVVVSIRHN